MRKIFIILLLMLALEMSFSNETSCESGYWDSTSNSCVNTCATAVSLDGKMCVDKCDQDKFETIVEK